MKLLLTSAGITNETIASSFDALIDKPAPETKIGFIPTAANAEPGNKDWFIAQLTNLQKRGYNWIDIVDPAVPGIDWRDRLQEVDALFVSGGNTFYLLDQFRKSGFDQWLKDNLEHKVYLGVSAGTIVASHTIEVATLEPADVNLWDVELAGLGLINFEIEPHCEGERFETIRDYAANRSNPVYALDDTTAIKVIDNKIEVVSEGTWKLYE